MNQVQIVTSEAIYCERIGEQENEVLSESLYWKKKINSKLGINVIYFKGWTWGRFF